MAKPTIAGKLGFFFDGGVGDQWIHNGVDWEVWPQEGGGGGTSILTADIMPSVTVGNIQAGTLIEHIPDKDMQYMWELLLIKKLTSGFTLTNSGGVNLGTVYEIGTALTPSFKWVEGGGVDGILLSDNVGSLTDVPVTGLSPYTPPTTTTYTYPTYKKVTWTLKGTDVPNIADAITWVYPTYTAFIETTSSTRPPIPADITTGAKTAVTTSGGVSKNFGSTKSGYGWFAVVQGTQTGAVYNFWSSTASASDNGFMSGTSFIQHIGTTTAHGATYDVFMFDQAKPYTYTITIKKK